MKSVTQLNDFLPKTVETDKMRTRTILTVLLVVALVAAGFGWLTRRPKTTALPLAFHLPLENQR